MAKNFGESLELALLRQVWRRWREDVER